MIVITLNEPTLEHLLAVKFVAWNTPSEQYEVHLGKTVVGVDITVDFPENVTILPPEEPTDPIIITTPNPPDL